MYIVKGKRVIKEKKKTKSIFCSYTVVGDYINIIKTTFDFNFDLYQAFKQRGNTKT